MLFNSFSFFIFLPIVFVLHWFVSKKGVSFQNIILLLASYFFYSFWDWRFSIILVGSTLFNYLFGIQIGKEKKEIRQKNLLVFSLIINIGVLCYFKYFNFFIDSFLDIINNLGFNINQYSLEILVPIGISFYTFHGISYVLDIYFGRTIASNNLIQFSLFISYFPLLVAGPIERATHLLPQFSQKRKFSYNQSSEGCKLILWGLFKKVVIADSLASIVDEMFLNYSDHSAIELIIGTISFAFQVYCDFSGYTDVARGVSKLFGIELIINFKFPYFSRSIPEFWSRWHISLTSWMNDYIFLPLSFKFRKHGKWGLFCATIITFALSGFWHGAGLQYISWGLFYGFLFIPAVFMNKNLNSSHVNLDTRFKVSDLGNISLTFFIICIGDILFRAQSLTHAYYYLKQICVSILNNQNQWFELPRGKFAFVYIIPLLIMDWYFSKNTDQLKVTKYKSINFLIYIFLSLLIIHFLDLFGGDIIDFIYFQF
jgi:alginate O-acetyltransferase complex protein AlgI